MRDKLSPEEIRHPRPLPGRADTCSMYSGVFLPVTASLRGIHARKLPRHAHLPDAFMISVLPYTSAQLPVCVAAPCPNAAIIQHGQAG